MLIYELWHIYHSEKRSNFWVCTPIPKRKYADEGKIKSIKNEAGQRLYDVESYQRGATRSSTICYCRVSSTKQRDNLSRQVEFMRQQYPEAEIIKDIGSGLNFKRKGLQTLLVRLMRGDKLKIIIACKDRLCRYLLRRRYANGFELFQFMVEQNGGEILVLDRAIHCPETELTADFITILLFETLREHIFSRRIHGLRSYSQKIKEDTSIPKP